MGGQLLGFPDFQCVCVSWKGWGLGLVIGAAVFLKLELINYIKGLVKGFLDERSIEDIVGLLDRKDLEKYTEIASRAFELYSDMNKSNTSE